MANAERHSTISKEGRRGWSLLELMAVVAIIAIVGAVALPTYRGYAQRAVRTAAQADLVRCAQGMERHASRTGSYAAAADVDGDGTPDADVGPVTATICVVEADAYLVALTAADAGQFVLQARPAVPGAAAGDGALALDSTGQRRWDRNDDGDFLDADETTWR